MSVAPVDINSLKPEDVVITSTPQHRKEEPKEPKIEEPKKEEPKAGGEPKKEEPKAGGEPKKEEPKKEEPKLGEDGKPLKEEPKLTEAQITDRVTELQDKDEEDLTEEEVKFLEDHAKEPEAEFDWEAFSQDVGIELDSDEAIVDSLKELAEYKSLSPALQKAIEIERNNGNVAAYFKAIANDPKELSDRDALWEQYVTENPKRVAGNPKFARLDFDRKLDKEYDLLTQYEKLKGEDQEEFLKEHKADLDYLKEKRKFEADAARATLQETRDKATFKNAANPEMDQKRADEIIKAHETGYKKAIAEFDVVSLAMGKDFEFNVGLSESNKKKATEWMKNPEAFLGELGFTAGKIDYDTLAGWAALIADIKYGTFGERLRQALVDNKDIRTLENTLDAPGIVKTGGGDKPILQGDEWDQVGEAFEKKRMESKKKR